MSSYYPSFNYMGLNSFKDKNLIVVHFESGDDGEMDTFLGMEQIYVDNPYGTKRITYGAKYNNVAVIRISVMKANGQDFSMSEVRDFLKWTTGVRQNSYLDLVDGETPVVSFLGHITSVYQQKIDARTVGFTIEHTSVGPWAYSPIQQATCVFGQPLWLNNENDNGIVYKGMHNMTVDSNGVLHNGTNAIFELVDNGVLSAGGGSVDLIIDNMSDDLYSYVNLDVIIRNMGSKKISITNNTLYSNTDSMDGKTTLQNIKWSEVVTLSSGQFITSDDTTKKFGYDFNFIWPKLLPGENHFTIEGDVACAVEMSYRYPIKIGDCAIDITVDNSGTGCCDCPDVTSRTNPVYWSDILDTPTTIAGYGIQNAYTTTEVNKMISNISSNVDDEEFNAMIKETLK